MNAFFEELFHTVASTKSNDLKILMIMKNCKQTNVTYSEFVKQTFFWKKGYSTIIWGGNKVTLQNISFLAVFSSDNFHFCGIHAYSSLNMKIGDQWSNYLSWHIQGYNALKRKMLFDEGMNFIEHCFWSSTFINTKINNILAVW